MALSKATIERQERQFAELIARGWSYADAFRQIKPRSRNWEPNALRVEACRFAKRPNVVLTARALLDAAKIPAIDSVGRAYQELLADMEAAREAGNHTALAAYSRIRVHVLGMLKEQVVVGRLDDITDEALVDRLAGGDAYVAAHIRRRLGREGFDA